MIKVTLPGFLIQSGLSLEEQPWDSMSSSWEEFSHSKQVYLSEKICPHSHAGEHPAIFEIKY